MSLTSEAEMFENMRKPVRREHHPNFHGDLKVCDYRTGHCTNTTACHDCMVYQSINSIRDYEINLKGK